MSRTLRLFLDSADPVAWATHLPLGIFHGVTTNPLLLQRAGQACTVANLRDLTGRARDLGAGEIHLQAWGDDADALLGRGRELAALDDGIAVAVKLPATVAGFTAARELTAGGTAITITAVYSSAQVLAAAAAGAAYAAPYHGRLVDAGRDGSALLKEMQALAAGSGTGLRLLAASLRTVEAVVDLARGGLDTFTCGPAVAAALLDEPLTLAAVQDFARAAADAGDAL